MFVPLKPTPDSSVILSNLEPDAYDKMVRDCVHALIVLGQNRNPIKKTDLNKIAFPSRERSKIPGAIIQAANRQLNKIFGMRLYEFEIAQQPSRYLLVNSKPGLSDWSNYSDDTCSELTTLYFILMDIFVSPDEKLAEEDIQATIKPLDHSKESIKEFLELFVKKLYLVQEKQQDSKMYSWGPRAYAEVEPENFFNCFLNLSGNTSAREWPDLEERIERLKNIANR